MMKCPDIPEIKARYEAATEGPWVSRENRSSHTGIFADGKLIAVIKARGPDAEFIAHARTDVPALVTALEEAQAEVKDAGCDEKFARADGKPCGECLACRILAILGESE